MSNVLKSRKLEDSVGAVSRRGAGSCNGRIVTTSTNNMNYKLLRVVIVVLFVASFGESFTLITRNYNIQSHKGHTTRTRVGDFFPSMKQSHCHIARNNQRSLFFSPQGTCTDSSGERTRRGIIVPLQAFRRQYRNDEDGDDELNLTDILVNDRNAGDEIIFRGDENDIFASEEWDELESNKPSEWSIVREVLGIGPFTYVLAALIVIFLSLNFILGPGWLGNIIGLPGTGSFEEVSEAFPDTMDLSGSEFSL